MSPLLLWRKACPCVADLYLYLRIWSLDMMPVLASAPWLSFRDEHGRVPRMAVFLKIMCVWVWECQFVSSFKTLPALWRLRKASLKDVVLQCRSCGTRF